MTGLEGCGAVTGSLGDFARLQRAIAGGNVLETLYRAGLDPMSFARIAEHWSGRIAEDAAVRAEYAALLEGKDTRARADAAPVPALRLPLAEPSTTTRMSTLDDAEVFPGERLARASDFARIARAAKRGAFKAAIARAGLDPDAFAVAAERFNARVRVDRALADRFARLLDDPRVD